MYGSLNISTSALIAQRTRMNVISANIAGANSILNSDGKYDPYRRREVIFATGDPTSNNELGVHVKEIRLDQSELIKKLQPDSPYADKDGYVGYPNVNPIKETVNAMEAARSYEANIAAIEASKSMISLALQMIA